MLATYSSLQLKLYTNRLKTKIMIRRKKSTSPINENQIAKIVDEIVKKKLDIDLDVFLKKYINNFLRDFENRQKKELTSSILGGIFGETGRGSSERQIMSSLFGNLLKKIF